MIFGQTIDEDIERTIHSDYIDWHLFKNSNVLVTGATGLVGSLLVKTILMQKIGTNDSGKIFVMIRSEEKAKSIFGGYLDDEHITIIKGDVRNPIEIKGNVDYIVHTAGVTTSKYMVSNPVETLMTSIIGTDNVLKLAKEKNVKGIVYLSSMEVYGATQIAQNPITEEKLGYIDVLSVRSSYSEGKRACENLCSAYAAEYDVPVKIARLAQTFGAGVNKNETKVFASFAKSVLAGEDIVLHTKGETMGNYCYSSDTVGALLCLMTRGEKGQAYTVVNDRNSMLIKEMAIVVSQTIGNGDSQVVFDIPQSQLTYGYAPETKMRLSGKKMMSLGWTPEIDLPDMYRRMVAAWEEIDCYGGGMRNG